VSILFILKIALTALRCVRPIGRFVLLGLKPSLTCVKMSDNSDNSDDDLCAVAAAACTIVM